MSSLEEQLSQIIQPSTPLKRYSIQGNNDGSLKRHRPSTAKTPPSTPIFTIESPLKGALAGLITSPFSWNDYQLVEVLGRGAFGVVYGLKRISDGKPFALKLVSPEEEEAARIEASILADLANRCSSLIRYYQIVYASDPSNVNSTDLRPGILMEWVQGPNLREEIKNKRLPNMQQFMNTTRQLLEQLACVHSAEIVHRDIKPENIVYDVKTQQTKLVDFGIGCTTGDQLASVPYCLIEPIGTSAYLAPELARNRRDTLDSSAASPASDIWALGATLYEWLFGQRATLSFFRSGVEKEILKIQSKVYVPDFLKQMLDTDPGKRPTAQRLLLEFSQ